MMDNLVQPSGEALISVAQTAREIIKNIDLDPSLMFAGYCLANFTTSKAQLFQDLLVAFLFEEKMNGFFVEFGATNGVTLSNSFLLEDKYKWDGILAEPARCWHSELLKNRKVIKDLRCVWKETGKILSFTETFAQELSTICEFADKDEHRRARESGIIYQVETVTLNDLLSEHGAPRKIDYISIDTEGSEFDILTAFDFSLYDVTLFTIEHANTPQREKIYALMTARGYIRIFENFSKWDDWYLREA